MALTPLLNNETISIDNHKSGAPIDIEDDGLHVHKRFNRDAKMNGDVEVIMPFIGNEPIVRGLNKKKRTKGQNHIISEIKRAFKDKTTRTNFVNSLRDALENLAKFDEKFMDPNDPSGLNDAGKKKINDIILRVASQFDVDENNLKEVLYQQPDKVVHRYEVVRTPRNRKIEEVEPMNNTKRPATYRTMYIQADINDVSFTLTRAKYMLNL